MKSFVITLPSGMVFKKHYCSNCGEQLQKEKVNRTVSKDDPDYYSYHKRGNFPRRDVSVTTYRFKCPECLNRYAYDDQKIIEIIQKKLKTKTLYPSEIQADYTQAFEVFKKRNLISSIIGSIVFAFLTYLVFGLKEESSFSTLTLPKIFATVTFWGIFIITSVYSKNKNSRLGYSRYDELIMEKLHAYASNNKKSIASSDVCHCFKCVSTFPASEVTEFAYDGISALCPKCKAQCVIPGNVPIEINENTLQMTKRYWF